MKWNLIMRFIVLKKEVSDTRQQVLADPEKPKPQDLIPVS